MKDPIKFTDTESQGITLFYGVIFIIMTIFLNSTVGLLWASIFAAVGIVGIYLRAWRRSVNASKFDNKTGLQNIFGKIANLYTQTGLLIQDSFNAPIAVIGVKSQSLHKDFQYFTKYMDTITLSIPQEVGVKIMSFFDLLFDYKNQADVAINSSKTNVNYDRWLDLKQRYEKIVAPRYTELEVYLRNILNDKDLTT